MIQRYRAWDKLSNYIFDVALIDFDTQMVKLGGCKYRNLDDVILMQSTGLKDKHDVEIFEGDVVKQEMLIPTSRIEEITGVVKMLEGAWTIVNDKKEIACNLWREGAEMEVIGNVWEGGDKNN